MSLMTESPGDAARRVALRRMRAVALGLLIAAAVIFVATIRADEASFFGYLNTAAEGAMVGALADWFAVTALFKHPLGLPIPHTAIIPKRKDEIARNLEEFVTENFFTEELARSRLADADVSGRLGAWLAEPANRDRVVTQGVRILRAALGRLSDDDVAAFLERTLIPRLVTEPISPIAGSLLEGIVRDDTHQQVVDLTLTEFANWLDDNPGTFAAVMGERAPKWAPPWVNDRVIDWSYAQVQSWLRDVAASSKHPARMAFDDLLTRLARDLQSDPHTMATAERFKERLLTHPQVAASVLSLWDSLRRTLISAMDDRSSYLYTRSDELLAEAGAALRDDPAVRTAFDERLADAVAFFVNTYGSELAQVISLAVDQWDGAEASRRIELFVGRDLQFIRINGTVIGALAGTVIHAVSQVLR